MSQDCLSVIIRQGLADGALWRKKEIRRAMSYNEALLRTMVSLYFQGSNTRKRSCTLSANVSLLRRLYFGRINLREADSFFLNLQLPNFPHPQKAQMILPLFSQLYFNYKHYYLQSTN